MNASRLGKSSNEEQHIQRARHVNPVPSINAVDFHHDRFDMLESRGQSSSRKTT